MCKNTPTPTIICHKHYWFDIFITNSYWMFVRSRVCILFKLGTWSHFLQVGFPMLLTRATMYNLQQFLVCIEFLKCLFWPCACMTRGGERKQRYLRKTAAKQLQKQTFWQINTNCQKNAHQQYFPYWTSEDEYPKTLHLFVEGAAKIDGEGRYQRIIMTRRHSAKLVNPNLDKWGYENNGNWICRK